MSGRLQKRKCKYFSHLSKLTFKKEAFEFSTFGKLGHPNAAGPSYILCSASFLNVEKVLTR